MAPSFEAAKAGYGNLWRSMTIRPGKRAALENAARKILAGKSRYLKVERTTGVPWFVIGVIHYREADCNFGCHLHNGDPLTARTYHVPAGRPLSGIPPFTWEFSATDALAIDGLSAVTDWSIERIGYMCERFNGLGYISLGVNSPYVWAGSNLYGDPPNTGKYIRDGVFDRGAIDSQLGCMPILKVMMELDASIAVWLGSPLKPVPPPPDVEPVPVKPPVKPPVRPPAKPAVGLGIGAAIAALAHWWGAHPGVTVGLFIAAIAIFAFIMSRQK
jgi:lysozyme family protein